MQRRRFIKATTGLLAISLLMLTLFFTACGSQNPEWADVEPDHRIYNYLVDAVRFGIIDRPNADNPYFRPDEFITGADFITMLGRMHEHINSRIPDDGSGDDRYLAWAVDIGIINSSELDRLEPNEPFMREQMAVIVYQYITAFDLWDCVRSGYSVLATPYQDVTGSAAGPIEKLRVWVLTPIPGFWYFRPKDDTARSDVIVVITRIAQRL